MPELTRYEPVADGERGPSPLGSSDEAPEGDKPNERSHAESQEKHLRNIHWVSPTKMIAFLLLGIIMSISHHLYYHSRAGKVVGDNNDQQNAHRSVSDLDFIPPWGVSFCKSHLLTPIYRIGNFFAFVVQSSLVMSMSFAYIQWLWMTLKDEEVSVGTLNSAFSAMHSILFVFSKEMRRKIKVGTLIALTAW